MYSLIKQVIRLKICHHILCSADKQQIIVSLFISVNKYAIEAIMTN